MRKKITVVGAGNVGATCAQELARRDYADVVLVDIKEGLPQGKALDIDQAAAVLGYEARVTGSNGYPGWKPDLDSPILKTAIAAYRDRFGREPEVKSIHAGLECGIIGDKVPGMDMVSFGPTLEGVAAAVFCLALAVVTISLKV